MWFAFVNSPLGPNMRVLKKFTVSMTYTEKELEILQGKVSSFLNLRVIRVSKGHADAIYDIVAVDPDTADLIRVGVDKFILAEIM